METYRSRPQMLQQTFDRAIGINRVFETWRIYIKKCTTAIPFDNIYSIQVHYENGVFRVPYAPHIAQSFFSSYVPMCQWRNFIHYFTDKMPREFTNFWAYAPKIENDLDFLKSFAYVIVKNCGLDFAFINDRGEIIES